MRFRRLAPVALIACLAACSDSNPPTPSPSPGPGTPVTIRGTERLGWDQQAVNQSELATFLFAIYVDGARSEMADSSCSSAVGSAGFSCSGRLPSMSSGQHTLELAAFVREGDRVMESPRSAPFTVTVSPAITTGSASVDGSSAGLKPVDGTVTIAPVAEGFTDITDVQATPDGRILVAERAGVARAIRDGIVDSRPVAQIGNELLSVVLDPFYVRSRLVYTLELGAGRGAEQVYRLVRYREAGGSFGERAVLLDEIAAGEPRPAGFVRFGPDYKLYVALHERAVARDTSADAAAGKILRLNPDGTTPSDQPGADRVLVGNFGAPRGFDWQPGTLALWIAEATPPRERVWRAAPDPRRARQGLSDFEHHFAFGSGVAAIAYYRGELIPDLRGSLLVAADTGLLQVRFDVRDSRPVVSLRPLIEGAVRSITQSRDGRLYVATPTAVLGVEAVSRK